MTVIRKFERLCAVKKYILVAVSSWCFHSGKERKRENHMRAASSKSSQEHIGIFLFKEDLITHSIFCVNHMRWLTFSSVRYEKPQNLFCFVEFLLYIASSRFHLESVNVLKFLNKLMKSFAVNEKGGNHIIGTNTCYLRG